MEMDGGHWYTADEGGFAIRVPAHWQAEADPEEEGGVELWHPDGVGELHLVGFASAADEPPDPAEELYAFLEEQGIELEEDEVEDLELSDEGELALCEYLSEDEETGETLYWLVGVAALPGRLVFAHYTCAADEEERERDKVRAILRTLRASASG
jgi:hypothetical protein